MAKNTYTVTELTDDLDGTKGDVTVAFSVDGATYEIDLNKKNKAAFDKALKPYVEAARRTRGKSTTRRGANRATNQNNDLAAVRAWAAENGYSVSSRGRVAREVREAYEAAQ